MTKLLISLILALFFVFPKLSFAAESFVTVVNPIRGPEFWEEKDQTPDFAVLKQMDVLKSQNVPATWLLRSDATEDKEIIRLLKSAPSTHEIGLFLEITPFIAKAAQVEYKKSDNWHSAGSVFLTGYSPQDRVKLIDASFEEFRANFGAYPKSVGAWFIDSFSLEYMQSKYDIVAGLIVADQYSTDNYQIWGQYFGAPYYPDKKNTLTPAQSKTSKIPVVVTQWAPRDPVNGYGKAVEESTYSVQANDYIDYHNLNTDYFSKLVDIYTDQKYNSLGQVVVGLENSYSFKKYGAEYANQIKSLKEKQSKGLKLVTMEQFAAWYKKSFPDVSPQHLVIADDPLGSNTKAVWFMNPYYRAGWFANSSGSVFRDIRQYIENQEELCYQKSCPSLNFATSATRVLDEVSFRTHWMIDEGNISDLEFKKLNGTFSIKYQNSAQKIRTIELLKRDIALDNDIYSIDTAILRAQQADSKQSLSLKQEGLALKESIWKIVFASLLFALFVKVFIFIPGAVFLKSLKVSFMEKIFLSSVVGFVFFTLVSYVLAYFKLWWSLYIYGGIFLVIFLRKGHYKNYLKFTLTKWQFLIVFFIFLGTAFQLIPVVKSSLLYDLGLGFWGPNAHDGIWHLALINQIKSGLPIQSPIFAGETLKNYHFLFDLSLASISKLTLIEERHLLFRFMPAFFSLLLGAATYSLVNRLVNGSLMKIYTSHFFALYLVYFSGSFGWVVTYLKEKVLSGESAFWANQSVSFNLNPPFAASLLILVALILIFRILVNQKNYTLVLISATLLGSLIGFKAYGFLLAFLVTGIFATVYLFKKQISLILVCAVSAVLSLALFIPNFKIGSVFIFSPFWLVHSMVDFPDRVGWVKLSSARIAYFERGEWPKYILAETLGLALFIAGNLGVRVVGLFEMIRPQNFKQFLPAFLLTLCFFSAFLPVLFIQQGSVWNTIQFFYYFLYFAAIFAAFALSNLSFKFPKVGLVAAFLIFAAVPINSLATAKGYLYPVPHAQVPAGELEALEFLKKQPPGVVLTFPFDESLKNKFREPFPLFAYDSTAYVSAFSAKPSFLEDQMQNELLGIDYKERRGLAKDVFRRQGRDSLDILKMNNIRYVYIPKFYQQAVSELTSSAYNTVLDEESGFRKIFENTQAVIYTLN